MTRWKTANAIAIEGIKDEHNDRQINEGEDQRGNEGKKQRAAEIEGAGEKQQEDADRRRARDPGPQRIDAQERATLGRGRAGRPRRGARSLQL